MPTPPTLPPHRRAPLALLPLALVLAACSSALKLAKDDSGVVLARHTIQAPDPTARGPYAVKMLYYGSGTDRRRAVYRDSVAVKTRTVDASSSSVGIQDSVGVRRSAGCAAGRRRRTQQP